VWHPLWREDGSVIYYTISSRPCQINHSWIEVSQNSRPDFTVSSETPPTCRARTLYLYPPETCRPAWPCRLTRWLACRAQGSCIVFSFRDGAPRGAPEHGALCAVLGRSKCTNVRGLAWRVNCINLENRPFQGLSNIYTVGCLITYRTDNHSFLAQLVPLQQYQVVNVTINWTTDVSKFSCNRSRFLYYMYSIHTYIYIGIQ
jgi:hypothetical protein